MFTSLCWPQDAAKPTDAASGSQANARSSDYVGSEVCVPCHSEQKKSFERTIMEKGKNKMPGYAGKLKDSEIKELVAYVRTLAKGK